MKTPTEISELLNALKVSGDLRKDPTYFVLVDILVDLNERLTVLEAKLALEESRTERLNSRLENIRIR